LRYWFDILTPKQVNFFKPVIDELRKRKHEVFCTSRRYREVGRLAQLRGMDLAIIGEHGGESLHMKLKASAERVMELINEVEKFEPDVLASFSSPEAARVAFGLRIKHVGFNDSPHAEAVCRLSIPLMSKLMCPWIIPVKEFVKYGISEKSIIQYRALDPAMWLKRRLRYTNIDLDLDPSKNTITFRLEESKAAYQTKNIISHKLLNSLIKNFTDCNIVIVGRYSDQVEELKKRYDRDAIVLDDVVDGISLLMKTDIFIGSGGTMNCEASLLGIPNISYNMQDIAVNRFLVQKRVSYGYTSVNDVLKLVRRMLNDEKLIGSIKNNGQRLLAQMEDPMKKVIKVLEQVN